MRNLFAVALILVVAGCGGGIGATPPASSASPPVHAEDQQGLFRLAFDLPHGTWRTGDAIDGVASLEVAGGGVDLGGSGGGVIGFSFAEVGGSRQVGPIWSADCAPYRLEPGKRMTSGITKSGAMNPSDPNADFYGSFLADPLVHLPAGEWTISAIASFVEGLGCSGRDHTMTATVQVHVLP